MEGPCMDLYATLLAVCCLADTFPGPIDTIIWATSANHNSQVITPQQIVSNVILLWRKRLQMCADPLSADKNVTRTSLLPEHGFGGVWVVSLAKQRLVRTKSDWISPAIMLRRMASDHGQMIANYILGVVKAVSRGPVQFTEAQALQACQHNPRTIRQGLRLSGTYNKPNKTSQVKNSSSKVHLVLSEWCYIALDVSPIKPISLFVKHLFLFLMKKWLIAFILVSEWAN